MSTTDQCPRQTEAMRDHRQSSQPLVDPGMATHPSRNPYHRNPTPLSRCRVSGQNTVLPIKAVEHTPGQYPGKSSFRALTKAPQAQWRPKLPHRPSFTATNHYRGQAMISQARECSPITSAGARVLAAISSTPEIGRCWTPEIAPGFAPASSLPNNSFLTSMSSKHRFDSQQIDRGRRLGHS